MDVSHENDCSLGLVKPDADIHADSMVGFVKRAAQSWHCYQELPADSTLPHSLQDGQPDKYGRLRTLIHPQNPKPRQNRNPDFDSEKYCGVPQ